MLTVVASYLVVRKTFLVGKVADLESVARCDKKRESTCRELLDDRFEERHVGGVVQIDPDLWFLTKMNYLPVLLAVLSWNGIFLLALPNEAGHFTRERMPILRLILRLNIE